jgi:hypothetical protein
VPRFKKLANRVQSFVVLRPKATAALAIAILLTVSGLLWTGKVVGEYRDKRHNEWRLRQMTDAVRKADERVRGRLTQPGEEADTDYRGVFETMREPTEPPPASDASPATSAPESKP